MIRFLGVISVVALTIMCQSNGKNGGTMAAIKPSNDPAAMRYTTYCASCHGVNAEGFIGREWKRGNTRTDIISSIKTGNPEGGMAAFEAVFKPKEIEDLADYILTSIESAKNAPKSSGNKNGVFSHASISIKLDTFATGLKNPWGMTFVPNGDMLLADRNGKFYRITPDRKKTEITGVPEVYEKGQGGLMDVALHPNFAKNQTIYLSYSKKNPENDKQATTAIFRAKLNGNQLSEGKDIFVAMPYQNTFHHYGSRIVFDTEGMLYFTVGDRGQHSKFLPQRLDVDMGKVHRLKDDGSIPKDNPFINADTAHHSIWTYGHRNPQGMAVHPTTGDIWTDEHGPKGGDELNLIRKGKNYGWPVISYGINYDGSVLTPHKEREGMEQPVIYWLPSIGPCGLVFNTSDKYPAWKGDLFTGSMSFKYLQRVKIENNRVVKQEKLLEGVGRVRCIAVGTDGYLYVAMEEPGLVFKLLPQ